MILTQKTGADRSNQITAVFVDFLNVFTCKEMLLFNFGLSLSLQ
jgi:hypothetical protein